MSLASFGPSISLYTYTAATLTGAGVRIVPKQIKFGVRIVRTPSRPPSATIAAGRDVVATSDLKAASQLALSRVERALRHGRVF